MKKSAAHISAALQPTPAPRNPLGALLLIAALVHLLIIFGVTFTVNERPALSKSLDVTLTTFSSEKAPQDADFIAQDNQQGSGTLDDAVIPKQQKKRNSKTPKLKKSRWKVRSSPHRYNPM